MCATLEIAPATSTPTMSCVVWARRIFVDVERAAQRDDLLDARLRTDDLVRQFEFVAHAAARVQRHLIGARDVADQRRDLRQRLRRHREADHARVFACVGDRRGDARTLVGDLPRRFRLARPHGCWTSGAREQLRDRGGQAAGAENCDHAQAPLASARWSGVSGGRSDEPRLKR
jgi:hypothetical protein